MMYYTMRKNNKEIRTYRKIKVVYLWLCGWKLKYRFEGSA